MRFRQVTLALTVLIGLSLVTAAQTTGRVVGSITAISGHTLTIQPDSGPPANVAVSDTARILHTQPGAKKLSDATPIALTDLAVGDRVLVVVNAGTATTIVAMKHEDIAQRQLAEAAEWRRGAAGLVKTVDAAAGTVTVASGPRTLTIHVTPKTIVRRYSPDSAAFAKATPSTLDQIHPGDQLRARGTLSADGSGMTADEIIAGTFRNIAGTVLSTDPAANTVTVNDVLSKKPIVIRVNPESQLHKLPPTMAQNLAARLKGMSAGAHSQQAAHQAGARQNGAGGGQQGENRGGGDLSRMLERAPTVTLPDLHKGDAVIIVATQGTPASATAVTLLAGVEPLLSAFPGGNQSVFSASWNLNGGGAGGGGASGAGAGGGEGGP